MKAHHATTEINFLFSLEAAKTVHHLHEVINYQKNYDFIDSFILMFQSHWGNLGFHRFIHYGFSFFL